MIAAVTGIVMSVDEARILLAELESQPDMAPNARVVAVQLKRVLNSKTAGLARFSQHQDDANTTPNTTFGPSSSALESGPVQDGQREHLTTAEAGARLGITANAVRELRRRGVLRGELIAGRWRFKAADIEARATRKE